MCKTPRMLIVFPPMLTTWRPFFAVSHWRTYLRFFTTQLLPRPKGFWQVSSHGRIWNTKGIISNGSLDGNGYRRVMILGQKWPVHRVVKITFHGLPKSDEAWEVHHLDGNKANNRLDNLEYVSRSQNMQHSYSNPSRSKSGPAQSKPVLWRPAGSTFWTRNPSATAAAQQLGIHRATVSRCCRKLCAAKGYEFKYQELRELTLPGEEWQQMVDPTSGVFVPGRMVSSFGRITSRRGLISRGHLRQQGYYTTKLCINADCRDARVHRLVAVAFLGPPPSSHQSYVNHKDLDKGNNGVENLEWVSSAENRAHFIATSAIRLGTTAKPVFSRPHGTCDSWRWHHSMASAARELGLHAANISQCIRGLLRQTGGHEFRLADATETGPPLPGEVWRDVDLFLLQRDREIRGLSTEVSDGRGKKLNGLWTTATCFS